MLLSHLILGVVGLHSADPQPKITVAEINLQLDHTDWIHQTSGLGSAICELEMDGGLRGEAPLESVFGVYIWGPRDGTIGRVR